MTINEFVRRIADSASSYPDKIFSKKGNIYTCVNPFSYHLVRKHPYIYENMDGLFVDGMTMCWWIRLLWRRKIPRLSFDMSGMASDLFDRLNKEDSNESIYFIGAKQTELEGTINQIRQTYPHIIISGYRNGYFIDIDDRNNAISEILSQNPSFTIIGMGSPLQEQFALDLKTAGYMGIAFTCGGFLHQTSHKINYYPNWVNKLNLRAFYRLTHEKGMFVRLWNVLIEFPIMFIGDSIKYTLSHR